MKKNTLFVCVLVLGLACSLLLAACSNVWQGSEMGTFRIAIGGGADGRALWPLDNDTIAKLNVRVSLRGGSGSDYSGGFNEAQGEYVFTVTPGTWTIIVEAFMDDEQQSAEGAEQYARGSVRTDIKAGLNGKIVIPMGKPNSVTFVIDGAEFNKGVNRNNKVAEYMPQAKPGYTISGWYTNSNFTGSIWNFNNTFPVGETRLYAQWVEIPGGTYPVHLYVNNGTLDKDQEALIFVRIGDYIPVPKVENMPGYTVSWYTDSALTNLWDFEKMTISQEMNLYAKWEPLSYKITYVILGDTPAQNETWDVNEKFGGLITDPSKEHIKTGYILYDWCIDNKFELRWHFDKDTVPLNGTTLYSRYIDVNDPVITFKMDGGKWAGVKSYDWSVNYYDETIGYRVIIQPFVQNNAATLNLSNEFTPERKGYLFDYWEYNGERVSLSWVIDSITTVLNTNSITLTAIWSTKVPGDTIDIKFNWLQQNAIPGVDYELNIDGDSGEIKFTPMKLFYNLLLTATNKQVLYLDQDTKGSLFTVEEGATFTLGKNITLQGNWENDAALVSINENCTLVMEDDSAIISNNNNGADTGPSPNIVAYSGDLIADNAQPTYGGGIYVYGGTLKMNGGEIGYNHATHGGGACIINGTFIMGSGIIYGNFADYGGGVYARNTIINKTNGTINGNNTAFSMEANLADNGSAVFAEWVSTGSTISRYRNKTAGPGINLFLSLTGSAPTFSGAWEGDANVTSFISLEVCLLTDWDLLPQELYFINHADQPLRIDLIPFETGEYSYTWYLNGEEQENDEEKADSFQFNRDPGEYEVAVMVHDLISNEMRSARCQIIVRN